MYISSTLYAPTVLNIFPECTLFDKYDSLKVCMLQTTFKDYRTTGIRQTIANTEHYDFRPCIAGANQRLEVIITLMQRGGRELLTRYQLLATLKLPESI